MDIKLPSDNIVVSGENSNMAVVRYSDDLSKDEIAKLKDHFQDLYGADPSISTVSPVIGKELAKNAIYRSGHRIDCHYHVCDDPI